MYLLRYSSLCMIISYVRLCALFLHFTRAFGHVSCYFACLSMSSTLSKMGRLWALTLTPVIVMTFEFCQRGVTVDTPFLTNLKTWTSSFEHSMIIHVHVRLEFSEVSVARLASRPLDLFVLCLVVHQTLVFLLLRARIGLLPSLALA